jgi:hypothetical protein
MVVVRCSLQVGGFRMAPGGKSKGPPPAVKKLLGLFGSGREEDKMVGYLSFLKVGPKLLKFLPGGHYLAAGRHLAPPHCKLA